MQVKRLIGRAISPLHQTVLEAIGVDKIIQPEQESAERLARSLEMRGIIDSFDITEEYNIIEVTVPNRYIGQSVAEANIRQKYNINVLTILKLTPTRNLFGKNHARPKAIGVVSPETRFEKDDILVLFGKMTDIEKLLQTG